MLWQNLSKEEQIASIHAVAESKNIDERAVEKDWWVTVVLKALSMCECSNHLLFKGGTSLSKGWNIINRFSEDIDLSIDREYYEDKMGYAFANPKNNTQLKKLRKASRDYIHGILSPELSVRIAQLGVKGFRVNNLTEESTPEGIRRLDHDSDPTVVYVDYDSVLSAQESGIENRIKIEVSCLSMSEPFEVKRIVSLLNERFSDIDEETVSVFRTVTPTRTFLEKLLLLNEEMQKPQPRSRRMSRHLYDIERILNTPYGESALADMDLYKAVVEHRRKFYHLGYVDYDLDYPQNISFIPTGETLSAYKRDYEENMIDGYIYGTAVPFDRLLDKMNELQERLHLMRICHDH